MFAYQIINSTGQKYYLSGKRPQIFILCGAHGDEYSIIPQVEKAVEKYSSALPDLLYVPIASPSANETKTRNNNRDQNFNRSFISETDNLEIKEIMGLLARISPLRLILDFHEDTILSEFYFYDTKALEKSPTLTSVREKILGLGVGLFNGVDNPNDPALGYLSIDGYIHQQPNPIGAIDDWLMSKKMVERSITPEIPGQISSELKAKIIDTIIETLILPEYGKAK